MARAGDDVADVASGILSVANSAHALAGTTSASDERRLPVAGVALCTFDRRAGQAHRTAGSGDSPRYSPRELRPLCVGNWAGFRRWRNGPGCVSRRSEAGTRCAAVLSTW